MMKLKLLVCLALVLAGSGHAAIIYSKAPAGGREMVVANVAPILQHDAGFFHGLKMEDLHAAEPVREFYVTNLARLASGQMLSATASHSWRYLLLHGTNAVGAATLLDGGTNGSALKYNDVQRPFFPNAPLDALRAVEKLPQIEKQDYEVRYLNIAPLNFVAVWLHAPSDDILIPLPPAFGRLKEFQPYSEGEVVKALKKDAAGAMKQPPLLR